MQEPAPDPKTHLQDLLDELSDQRQRQTSELVLLEQLVQVDAEELENQAQVVLELKAVQQPHDVLRIAGVVTLVKLGRRGGTAEGGVGATTRFDKLKLTATPLRHTWT